MLSRFPSLPAADLMLPLLFTDSLRSVLPFERGLPLARGPTTFFMERLGLGLEPKTVCSVTVVC